MPDEGSGLTANIAKWLETQGYPLEMRAARELRSHGVNVDIGRYYTDLENSQQREIDIVASCQRPFRKKYSFVEVSLVIECKSSKEKPWILFTDTASRFLATRWWWNYIDEPERWLSRLQAHIGKADRTGFPLLGDGVNVNGYGLVRAFAGNNEDVAFSAMVGAVKATSSVLESTRDGNEFVGSDSYFVHAVPVVLIDGPLFLCHLDGQGKPRLVSLDRGTVVWRYRVAPSLPDISLVTIATMAALPSLARDAVNEAEGLANLLDRHPPKSNDEN